MRTNGQFNISVYNYFKINSYLKDIWKNKSKKNPSFSIRSWAANLGFEHHSSLHSMVTGKRNIPKKYIPKFIESLKLTPKEGIYFELLVDFQRAKTDELKHFYLERLRAFNSNRSRNSIYLNEFQYLKDPYHIILLEMIDLKGFKNDANWIKEKLLPKKSIKEIKEIFNRLIELNLLSKDENGNLVKSNSHLETPHDVNSIAVQEYHKTISGLAQSLISKIDIDEREYNSFTLNIEKKKIPHAKKLIREFTNHFIKEMEANKSQGENTYQMNVQLFQITNSKKD